MSNTGVIMSELRNRVRRLLVNGLAVAGALTLFSAATGFVIRRLAGDGTGIVLGENQKPLPGVPVFLDRGATAIERVVTDSAGRFQFQLEPHELRHAVWLICAPGAIPMIGSRDEGQAGPGTYYFTALKDSTFGWYRAKGWRGPIPRSCPKGTDSVGWRYPTSSRLPREAFSLTEPQWP